MSYAPWLSGPDGQQWKLENEKYLLGRDAPADIVLDSPRISRQHALLTRVDRGHYLGDLGSRNGTFVNGQAVVNEAVRLKDGDEIVLGGVIALKFHDPSETAEGPRLGKLRGIWVDEATRAVWVDAKPVEPPLSAAQFTLMKLLYQQSGNVVSRPALIAAVWPDSDPAGVSEEAVDGLIKRLRARLRETQPEREHLEVLRGQGVRLTDSAADSGTG